jgi:diadenosine tetraphosphate (Ap4A) HIT family hydrolase
LSAGDVLAQSEHAACFPDQYPLNPGHLLVVSRRHEPDFYALTAREQADVWSLVAEQQQRSRHESSPGPDGYNVGLNVGRAAGQTVEHAHVHLIPRFRGDVQDPRGGVRWVLPARAAWWCKERPQ